MIDSTKLSGYPYSPTKMCDMYDMQKQPSSVKETQQSKVESHLKDECMA